MANPFLAEIRCFGFNFAPKGWAMCNGQLMAISQNTALFSLLGTNYGGNGKTTFGLPDLRGKLPMHWGSGPGGFNTVIGEVQGTPTVTLMRPSYRRIRIRSPPRIAPGGLAQHTAIPGSSAFFASRNPTGSIAAGQRLKPTFAGNMVGSTGASQPHDNMQPYLALNFCIALQGIFPSRN